MAFSMFLLVMQLTAMFYLGLFILQPAYEIISIALVAMAILIGGWGVWEMQKKSKFSALPEVKRDATLVTTGPYAYIRNPMYLALILVGLATLIDHPQFDVLVIFVILIVVIISKIKREEYFLRKKFKDYGVYKNKTKRLIPFIY